MYIETRENTTAAGRTYAHAQEPSRIMEDYEEAYPGVVS